jgi:DNA (cytosine-5)-methyltransferase 1
MVVSKCLTARGAGGQNQDPETATLLPIAIQDVRPIEKAQNGRGWNDDGTAYTVDTHATQGVAQPIIVHGTQDPCVSDIAFAQGRNNGGENVLVHPFQQTADCLTAAYGTKWNGNASATNGSLFVAHPMAQSVGTDIYNAAITGDVAVPLTSRADGTGTGPTVMQSMAVRRLTPVECERLQGFPDNYTDIKSKNKPTPDGPRYKALGNSMAVPVMAWIGQRIEQVEAICKQNK